MTYELDNTPRSPASEEAIASADTVIMLSDDDVLKAGGFAHANADHTFSERYERVGVLGEGGMGIVKLCRDARIGRTVALKEIHPEMASNRQVQARFVREVRLQGQLEHPAIVPVYDLGVNDEGGAFFSMKRVRGVTLEQVLEGLGRGDAELERRFTLRKLLSALANVCLAAQFAHERGVYHRDLKPANIMLGDFGEVYVLDWGIAKVTGSQQPQNSSALNLDSSLEESQATLPGFIIGTPGYLAPELVLGDKVEYAPRTDVYSLGTILFEILTLKRLHDVDSANALVAAFVSDKEVRPSERAPDRDIPPELDVICLRACAQDPLERYASARQVHEAIDGFLEGQRDQNLRTELANQHSIAARQAADKARSGDRALAERRRAMQEIGRALALDPDNVDAMDVLEQLLREPPEVLPPEVKIELGRSNAEHHRHTARIGAISYASLIIYLPLVALVGIRDATGLWGMYSLAIVLVALSTYVYRMKRPTTAWLVAIMALSNLMYVCTWPVFGPLVMLPTILVANTTSFALHLDRRARIVAVATGCLAVILPVLLESAGLFAPSYHFTGDDMIIHASMVELGGWTTPFLTVVTLAAMINGAVVVSHVRDALHQAERRLYTYTWHLREFVPQAARSTTDPTIARQR